MAMATFLPCATQATAGTNLHVWAPRTCAPTLCSLCRMHKDTRECRKMLHSWWNALPVRRHAWVQPKDMQTCHTLALADASQTHKRVGATE
eukprot:5421512-Alexandrium_andersonii.AAC.1